MIQLQVTILERNEALQVMREISAKFGANVMPCWVSLDGVEGKGYSITLKCDLDEGTRDVLKTLIARHEMKMEERDGTVVIRR